MDALTWFYGFLQGAWPFGVVEAIWTIVALRRWQLSRTGATSARPSRRRPTHT
jgi:hypothetical protein